MISVIIPTYNREKNIKKSIESVLAQSYKDFELLIIDDGSKDGTEMVVKTIDDPRVKYIKYMCNRGAAHARNVGIREAKGEFIAFHDSDDVMRKDRLEKQLLFIQENNVEFVFAQVYEHDLNGRDIGISPDKCNLGNNKTENTIKLLKQWQIWCQTILCTSECAKNIMFDERFPCGIDWDFSIRVAMHYNMKFQPLIVSDNYRLHSSISANEYNQYKCHFLIKEKHREIIESNNELRNFYIVKDFDYKYSFKEPAFKEALEIFKLNKDVFYLLKGMYSIFR